MISDKPRGFLCGPKRCRYKGFYFENNSYSVPWPLKKNGDPKAQAGRTFWKMFREWDKLSLAKREKTMVGGGCRSL